MLNQNSPIKVLFGVIIVLLVGFGIVLATRIFDPFWNPFRPSPQRVLESSLQKMRELRTFSFKTQFNFEAIEANKKFLETAFSFKEDIDKNDPSNLKIEGDFNLDFIFDQKFSLAGESKIIGDNTYFKITNPPDPSLSKEISETLGVDFIAIQDQWIKFNQEQFFKILGGEETEKEVIDQIIQERRTAKAEAIKKLNDFLKSYKIKRTLQDQEVNGVKAYHYLISLNESEARAVLPEIISFMGQFLGPEGVLDLGILQDLLPRIDEFFQINEGLLLEVWIGQKDNYLYKISFGQEVPLARFAKPLKKNQKPQVIPSRVNLKININFSNFNKQFQIEEPPQIRFLEDIISKEFHSDYFEPYFLGD